MVCRTRLKYTPEQKADIWNRWQKGESLNSVGRLFDRPSSSIFNILAPTGGIRSPIRKRSKLAITLSEREEISRVLNWGTGDIPAKCRTGLYKLALIQPAEGHWFSKQV